MLNQILYYYTLFFTLVLTLGGLISGFAFKNPLATAFFLPIPLSLFFETVRRLALFQYQKAEREAQPPPLIPITYHHVFDLRYFFAQKNPLFLTTLALYVIVFTAALLRTGSSFLPAPPLISPIPSNQLVVTSR